MTALDYRVYVSPAKPVVSDDLPPGEDHRMWSPTASTLVHGEHDAVLVDPLMTVEESRALAEWVAATGRNLTTVFVSHAHGDHFFGAPALLERFPDARLVATAGVAEHMRAQYGPRWFGGFWDPRFPGQIDPRRLTAEPLGDDNVIELEGERLQAVELGHADTDGSSALPAATSSSSTSPPGKPRDTGTSTRRWSPSTRTGSTGVCCGTPRRPSWRDPGGRRHEGWRNGPH